MRKITTAVLLAAGRGKRLRPHTDCTPKPLLSWKDRPTVDWILESLHIAGVNRVVLITGHLEAQIQSYAEDYMQLNPKLQIRCVSQPTLDGTAGAVSCALSAHSEWFDQPYLVSATDYLVPESFYPQLLSFHQQHNADISVSLKVVPPEELGSRSAVAFNGDYNISKIVEKPEKGTAPSKVSANLIFVLPPTLNDLIIEVAPSARGEKEIQSAINTHLANGGTGKGVLQITPDEWDPVLGTR